MQDALQEGSLNTVLEKVGISVGVALRIATAVKKL